MKIRKADTSKVRVLKDSFFTEWQKGERLQPEAPSGRELAPQATEGERVTIKFSNIYSLAGSFRHASRATFLPEEGFLLPSL